MLQSYENNEREYIYGKIDFPFVKEINGKRIKYTTIPYAYLCVVEEEENIYIFPNFKELEEYFKKG